MDRHIFISQVPSTTMSNANKNQLDATNLPHKPLLSEKFKGEERG